MKKGDILVLVLAIVVVFMAFVIYFENFSGEIKENESKIQINKTQVANPASIYCLENGGNISIRTDKSGEQYGVCIFSNGSECEEWKFFRGECNLPVSNISYSDECEIDSDCVPSTCCHPSSCINKNSAPNCEGIICTMECRGLTLDCGQGSCKCLNKKCNAVLNQ